MGDWNGTLIAERQHVWDIILVSKVALKMQNWKMEYAGPENYGNNGTGIRESV